MSDSPTDFRPYAGQVVFPRTPADLTSPTTCPACLSPVGRKTACPVCGLELRGPDATELALISQQAAALMDQRLTIIGRIRYAMAQRTAPAPAPVVATQPVAQPVTVAAPAPAAAPAPEGRHWSSIQVILLIVGISLLSVAAIFFLVYAFITYGLNVRSIIVGAVTAAAIVVATVLRRRHLPATAEGIAAFAVVLVYLDVWAIHANNFFGAESTNLAAYWGFALLITGALLYLWTRLTGLRLPSVVGFAAVAPGVGLLVGWALRDLQDDATGVLIAFLATAVVGLLARFGRLAERIVALTVTSLAVVGAILTAFFVEVDADWAGTLALVIVAIVAGAHLVLARTAPTPVDTAYRAVIGALGAGALAGAAGSAASRIDDPAFSAIVPLIAATAVALALEAAHRIRPGAISLTASITAGAVALATVVLPVVTLLGATGIAVVNGLFRAWSIDATDPLVRVTPVLGASAVGLTVAVLLVLVAWLVTGVYSRRGRILTWAITILALLVMPTLSITWFVLVGWEVLAALALIALLRGGRWVPDHATPALVTAFVAGLSLAYAASWAALDTWGATSLLMIAALVIARVVFRGRPGARAALLGPALVILIIGAGAGARDLALPLHAGTAADAINVLRALGFAATLLLGLNGILRLPSISTLDRRVGWFIAAPVILVTTISAQFVLGALPVPNIAGILLPEYLTSLAVSVFLLAALLAWTLSTSLPGLVVERIISSIALAPAVFWLLDSAARATQLGDVTFGFVIVLSLLHVAGLAIPAFARMRPTAWAAILLAAIVGIVGLATGDLARIEYVSVPVGLALMASGTVHLVQTPAARSWAWLAPGVGILLVPSLVATAWDAPVWRIVGLGIAGVLVIVGSLLLRLQAPFVISVVVVLIHAIATFSPELRFVYQSVAWWIWLAIGGVIIVVLSIRFEQSRQGVKKVISSVAALR